MAKILDNSEMEDFVINYIDQHGEPCTWIGSEKGLRGSEPNCEIKMIIPIIKNERN